MNFFYQLFVGKRIFYQKRNCLCMWKSTPETSMFVPQMLGHQRGLALLVDHQRTDRRLYSGKCPEPRAGN